MSRMRRLAKPATPAVGTPAASSIHPIDANSVFKASSAAGSPRLSQAIERIALRCGFRASNRRISRSNSRSFVLSSLSGAGPASAIRSKYRTQAARMAPRERNWPWRSANDNPAARAISVNVVRRQPWRSARSSAASTTRLSASPVAVRRRGAARLDADFRPVAMDGSLAQATATAKLRLESLLCQFARAPRGGGNRVANQPGETVSSYQHVECGARRAARAGPHLAQLCQPLRGNARQFAGTGDRGDRQPVRERGRESLRFGRLGQTFDEQENIGWPAARKRRHRIEHVFFVDPGDLADRAEKLAA